MLTFFSVKPQDIFHQPLVLICFGNFAVVLESQSFLAEDWISNVFERDQALVSCVGNLLHCTVSVKFYVWRHVHLVLLRCLHLEVARLKLALLLGGNLFCS